MRIITILFYLLCIMGGIAQGQLAPRNEDGSQTPQARGQMSQGSPRGYGPPPEAFKACEGKIAGSTAQFTGPGGETLTGTCRSDGERLVLRPNQAPGNSRDGRRQPPPEAYQACEGKLAGSVAQFVNPRGENVRGTCEEEEGRMVLRPNRSGSNERSR